MSPVYQAALRSWAISPAATFAIALAALVYLRGWWLLRSAGVPFLPPWRAAAFLVGLFSLWCALASPMDVFNGFVLTAHMLQHMVLMMLAPPLILLGAPVIPMVRGLPIFAAREFAGPFLNWTIAQRIGRTLTYPVVASLLMALAMFSWHTPALYELALHSSVWHQVEHACFFLTALIFWWPVVQPWPSRAQWPRWALVPYLLVADLQNTALSAILVFADRVLYPSYSDAPRVFGLSASQDQAAAGALMWVVGSLAYIVPAVVIAVQCLSRKPLEGTSKAVRQREPLPSGALPRYSQESLRVSGSVPARWRSARVEALVFVVLFVVAALSFARLLAAGSGDDDDQALRYKGTSGPLVVAIFASGDLAVGSLPVSVLVQDGTTQEVLLDTTVDLSVRPSTDTKVPSATERASARHSPNKLMQTAELRLPAVGDWMLNVGLRRDSETAEFALPLQVVKSGAGFEVPWAYLGMLISAGILSMVYLRRHRAPKARYLPVRSPSVVQESSAPGETR